MTVSWLFFFFQYCIQAWGPQHKKDVELWEQLVARGGNKDAQGLEQLACEERLRELGVFGLEKGELTAAFQCLKGAAGQLGRDYLSGLW